MPELPEVETIRRDLLTRILNTPITEVIIRLPKIVRGEGSQLQTHLLGRCFTNIERTGKLLQLSLNDHEGKLHIHLKMTGQLLYQKGEDFTAGGHPFPAFNEPLPNKFTHFQLSFADGGKLFFNDLRQFGYIHLVTPEEHTRAVKKFGLEPLRPEFTWENFSRILDRKKGILKAVLLDQSIFSGLGNIYADEVCFFAKVRPDRRVESLTETEKRALFDGCQTIIAEAVEKRGTTFRDYKDSEGKAGGYAPFLKVYGRGGEPCQRCSGVITKTRLAGRGTHFCPTCQR